ncbi:hypothetical protein BV20DRAFT_149738 [Pilatotrama ljubarskyi]|nr:hypothetical protein BV20DRAFT_149738 [Pilatotrama ljubarskyi]
MFSGESINEVLKVRIAGSEDLACSRPRARHVRQAAARDEVCCCPGDGGSGASRTPSDASCSGRIRKTQATRSFKFRRSLHLAHILRTCRLHALFSNAVLYGSSIAASHTWYASWWTEELQAVEWKSRSLS